MIVSMARVRIMGPRLRLPEVIAAVQDAGVLHLAEPEPAELLAAPPMLPHDARCDRHLHHLLDDAETALRLLGLPVARRPAASTASLPRLARAAARARRRAEALAERTGKLEEERALLKRYQAFLPAFATLRGAGGHPLDVSAYHVVLQAGRANILPALRAALQELTHGAFELLTAPLEGGQTALLLLVPPAQAGVVERALRDARVEDVPVPRSYGTSLVEAIPRMIERGLLLPAELAAVGRERADLARTVAAELLAARAAAEDGLGRLAARPLARVSPHAFLLEGWVPETQVPRLTDTIQRAAGPTVVLEKVRREEWHEQEAPVVLRNPRLFRPFETVTQMLPLPRYGSIDPTPYVAVGFPMFFGLMLGDAGYGAVLALLAWILHVRSRPGSTLRAVSEIMGAGALFTIAFGLAFGEVFGDLGHRWFGLEPLLFDRGTQITAFLGLAVALGAVHLLLGLVLSVVAERRHPRLAVGHALSAISILLLLVATLAAVGLLPGVLKTPAVVAIFVAFPVLVALEGIVAPIEFLSTLGHILSYARVMALGTASVMLAIVANQVAGTLGSVLVGVVFALLFHTVNFALGLFGPTIHALRLHYVEFFGTFYSPGGTRYTPLAHHAGATPSERISV